AHPVLPSFPTRRSSDLGVREADAAEFLFGKVTVFVLIGRAEFEFIERAIVGGLATSLDDRDRQLHADPADREGDFRSAVGRRTRSEEHTSELQSRGHLV